jgi:hypothetical protein
MTEPDDPRESFVTDASRTDAPPREADPAGVPPPLPADFEPPWREARRRVVAAWGRGRLAMRIALVVGAAMAAALLGGFLFGLWHVVVGGFLRGNWNAAGFGFALAGVTGVLLWIEASIARRLLPPAAPGPGAGNPRALP